MKRVSLTPFHYQDRWHIAIKSSNDPYLEEFLKAIKEVRWSQGHQCFYTPFSAEKKKLLFHRLRAANYFVDYSSLQNFFPPKKIEKSLPAIEFSKEQKKILHEYVAYLKGLRLGGSSVRAYYNFVLKLVHFMGDKPVLELERRDIERFIEQRIAPFNYSLSSHRQCISAIKHFLILYDCNKIEVKDLKRPRKDRYLPTILSKEEVISLLQASRNLKHRAILALIYSCGLRVGELINLKLAHIDIARRQVFVKNSKGRKDRVVVLAESMLPLMHNYLSTYLPKEYFAEGQTGGQYSSQSIRLVLRDACRRIGLRKKVTPHTLRHSYATHMLENGIDLRYIQELLGHSRPETTMIYTHVSRKDLLKIESPLDIALKELYQTGKSDENLMLSRKFKG